MKKVKFIFWMLISVTILSFFLLSLLGKRSSKALYNYINAETKRFTSNVISSVINDTISDGIEDELFTTQKNSNDEIETLDYNTKKVNEILSSITNKIQKRLTNLEEGDLKNLKISDNFRLKNNNSLKNGILCKVPMGSLRGNTLLVNLGPNIPLKIAFIGQVQSNLNTKITNYGINNLVLQVDVQVEIEQYITMPIMSKKSVLRISAPLTIKIIQGIVPNYYLNGLEKNSNAISTPIS